MSSIEDDTSRPRVPLEHAVEAWRRDMGLRLGLSDLHVRKCGTAALRYGASAGISFVDEIDAQSVMRWLQVVSASGGGGGRKTALNSASAMRMFCDYLELTGEIDRNPVRAIRMPRARRRPGALPFTIEEVRRLIASAELRERSDGRCSRFGPLASTFYRFLLLTALRYGESRRQKWADISLENRVLVVTADKSGRRDAIPVAEELVAVLGRWREFSRGEALFPHTPSHHTLLLDMAHANVSGTTEGRKGEWHRFRKAAVTERALRGAQVRDLHKFARHTSATTTLNHYDFMAVDELRTVADMLPRIAQ